MKKFTEQLRPSKKKMATAAICAALVLTLGATAFAANNLDSLWGKVDDNGAFQYSTDGGKTWGDKTPEGYTASSKDGVYTVYTGNGEAPHVDGKDLPVTEKNSIAVKQENGKTLYSTDDGKTWSEKAPEGYITSSEDGVDTIYTGSGKAPDPNTKDIPATDVSAIAIKQEDGKTLYSTDGGKTWTEELPEGYALTTDQNGVQYVGNENSKDADAE